MLNIQQVSSTVIIKSNQSVFVSKEHTELTPVTFLTFLALQALAFPIRAQGRRGRKDQRSQGVGIQGGAALQEPRDNGVSRGKTALLSKLQKPQR